MMSSLCLACPYDLALLAWALLPPLAALALRSLAAFCRPYGY